MIALREKSLYYLNEIQDFMPAMHDIAIKTELLRKNNVSITEHCFIRMWNLLLNHTIVARRCLIMKNLYIIIELQEKDKA